MEVGPFTVSRAEALILDMPLRYPFRTAMTDISHRITVLVHLESAEAGAQGWGEFGEIPGYSNETVDSALIDLEALATGHPVPSHRMAPAAWDAAHQDLIARSGGHSLAHVIGGIASTVPAGAVVGIKPIGEMLDEMGHLLEVGYRKIKLKIRPGHDLELIRAARSTYPTAPLAVDANGSYQASDQDHLARFDHFRLLYLEQPFPASVDPSEYTQLTTRTSTPVCLDEGFSSQGEAEAAVEAGVRVLNVKGPRLAGLAAVSSISRWAVERGVSLVGGGLLETGVGRGHAVAIASLPGFDLPSDLAASDRYWEQDITRPWELRNGHLEVPDAPGIGVEPEEKILERYLVSRVRLGQQE